MSLSDTFSAITGILLQYETGDFLQLSDLDDRVSELRDPFLNNPEICSLLDFIKQVIHREMKHSGQPEFQSLASEGLDLLQAWVQAEDSHEKTSYLGRIQQFLRDQGLGAVPPLAPSQVEENLQIFLRDARDRLAEAQTLILDWEKDLQNREIIQHLFRIFHTIKGECGFLKIATLGELTHNLESLLDMLLQGKVTAEAPHVDLLLEGLDLSKAILEKLQAGQVVVFSEISLEDFLRRLSQLEGSNPSSLGEILVQSGKLQESEVTKILQKQKESAFTKKFGEIAVQENYLTPQELQDSLGQQKADPSTVKEKADPLIKVRASKVNFLVDMIGELLISMGQLTENSPAVAQIRKITRSLQYGAMELRTETVRNLFGNLKRMVRDLSKKLDKPVDLILQGDDLEIDRNLIEKLEEPLIHMVRNALDHGLEPPEERQEKGKNPTGRLLLAADRRGNSIVITLEDDGRGLQKQKILNKALEKGLIRRDQAPLMTDNQIYNLIFQSGFSTQENLSQISGRGVGMDIVRSVVTENRGRIEIETSEGAFTRFHLVFPLSTAIIDGMITRVADNHFIFPIGSVLETLQVKPSMISTVNGRVEVVDLRGTPILVLRMHQIFDLPAPEPQANLIAMVVENTDRKKFMLLVDEVIAKREVVIKSLGNRFNKMQGISSGTVLGGGKIGLVVDVDQIVDLSLTEEGL